MKVNEIIGILKAQVLNEGNLEEEVKTACGSDMGQDHRPRCGRTGEAEGYYCAGHALSDVYSLRAAVFKRLAGRL